jgi:hypothetical protein
VTRNRVDGRRRCADASVTSGCCVGFAIRRVVDAVCADAPAAGNAKPPASATHTAAVLIHII